MIIMINGAFGVGKTTVAQKLLTRLENSMLYDPEIVGFMLRAIITEDVKKPEEKTEDFQDLTLWRELTVDVAKSLVRHYNKNLIVPMTICNQAYFEYIRKGFQEIDEQTFHFCLIASEQTIHERLRKRGEAEGNWCFQQTKRCVEAFTEPCFDERIPVDHVNADEVVDTIVANLTNGRKHCE
ncbi:AAA family ATPase [Brevibacillus sp. SYSU BS000544]|uniref:AAA family ATPase n=1 Tax=Brevibacillus sp. SYSU BS000544 TaxID=3416443 RepID=UPI003CE58D2F